jgi:polyphosphate kinase 2 (PPK2 family)
VLVVRVHQQILAGQKLPPELVTRRIWKERCEDIASFERYLSRNGVAVVKFFLNVSKKEQKKRFLDRLQEPDKNWKFALGDVEERKHWDSYMEAYEEAIRATAAPWAPWYVVPANAKWFTRLAVASAVIDALEKMGLAYPEVDDAKKAELEQARVALESSKG